MVRLILIKYINKSFELIKYVIVSFLALIVDYCIYWFSIKNNFMDISSSALFGYICGLFVAYYLMITKIYINGSLKDRRIYEFILFLVSGILGLFLTFFTVKIIISLYGENIYLAKLSAIAVSFIGVYIFRMKFIFKLITIK